MSRIAGEARPASLALLHLRRPLEVEAKGPPLTATDFAVLVDFSGTVHVSF